MQKSNVVRIRDLFHNAGCKVVIYCDNSLTFNELDDVIVWDDDNEIVYCMSRTKNVPSEMPDKNKVVYFTAFDYDVIQFFTAYSNYETFEKDIIDNIPVRNSTRVEKIKDFFKDTIPHRVTVRPGAMTEEELAREKPELYDSVHGEGAAEEYLNKIKEYRESLKYSEEKNGKTE